MSTEAAIEHPMSKILKKKKEFFPPRPNCKVRVVAVRLMTEEQERRLSAAIDALLGSRLKRLMQPRIEGEFNEQDRYQQDGHRRPSAEQHA